jgi:hypothetical protein
MVPNSKNFFEMLKENLETAFAKHLSFKTKGCGLWHF